MMYFEEDCQLGFADNGNQNRRHDPLFDGVSGKAVAAAEYQAIGGLGNLP